MRYEQQIRRNKAHPTNGLGWLYVTEADFQRIYQSYIPTEEEYLSSFSGQSDRQIEHAWAQTRKFTKGSDYYKKQIDNKLEQMDRLIIAAEADVIGAQRAVETLRAERARIEGLL